jgi:APA family basic amino acid/polyamine antiporter
MIAAGLFINPSSLTQLVGPLGFIGYMIAGLLMFPVILSVGTLAKLHPVSGGLYVYSKSYIGQWAGFLSGWGYFVGKTVSAALLMHKFNVFFQTQFSVLDQFSTLTLDYTFLSLLIIFNICGANVGGRIQYVFTALKAIPILFVFVMGFVSFDTSLWQLDQGNVSNIFLIIPLCVFAMTGFEIICSVGHMIENAKKNIKSVILTAFLIVITVDTLFQFLIYGALGSSLAGSNTLPILALAQKSIPSLEILGRIFNGSVYAAILGACFSILTTNCWNLHTLAVNDHIPFKTILTRLSYRQIPWVALVIEGLLGCLVLTICNEQTTLINLSMFAQLVAIFLSMIAASKAVRVASDAGLNKFIPIVGICTSFYILGAALINIVKSGVSFPFLAIFLFGIILALAKYFLNQRKFA